jgi:hypothetical protein
MKSYFRCGVKLLFFAVALGLQGGNASSQVKDSGPGKGFRIEYADAGKSGNTFSEIPRISVIASPQARITVYRNISYEVIIHEIDRGSFTEINGELVNVAGGSSCITLRICVPVNGQKWTWFHGLDKTIAMQPGSVSYDTLPVRTVLPPDGAFNGKDMNEGGYGNAVGQGTMSYYPLCAVGVDGKGTGMGIDMTLPVVYRLAADSRRGLIAEFDLATSPLTDKFPNRAFFKMCSFGFDPKWGMRAALEHYYRIYPEAFKKRVEHEGIWLPFTALRSIPAWEDFGFAFHETSWGSFDQKEGKRIPGILSDKGTGVMSFQYTEPWDIQLPIGTRDIGYDTVVSQKIVPAEHREYLDVSATRDKNNLLQARRLETPWFSTGWAVSITTSCDPDLPGFSRYRYILRHEIDPARKMNVDGIYFDSMEWNWHHDLNYREDHFKYTDYPLTFSKEVAKPAIWNFAAEFEFMKKVADEMHAQGKLAMGNGHGWNPFAAANLDLFGAELNWYSSDDHNTEALDFKRAISFQKSIVFLLNEGLNDKAFTESPFNGYEIYFEKLLAYGFFPSFFSVDASNDPYWQDPVKIENGRPFFKKYIPIIQRIAAAGWQPVTGATGSPENVRIERFGHDSTLFFTLRNTGSKSTSCVVTLDDTILHTGSRISAIELVNDRPVKVEGNRLYVTIPPGRTQVVNITSKM